MASNISLSGLSFELLSNSSGFLNEIINNISSCILLLNNKMELQAYNEPLKTIFSNKKDEDLLYKRCGEAIGCAYTVEESKNCGETSNCKYCKLRESGIMSYLDKKAVYKERLDREFFKTNGKKVLKHLQFSTKPFEFKKEYYIVIVIEDITTLVNQEKLIKFQQNKIEDLMTMN